MNTEREPWFYGCLSWMIPGLGQLYGRMIPRGLLLLLLWVLAGIAGKYLFATSRFVGLLPALAMTIATIIVVPAIAAWDVVHIVQTRRGTPSSTPDPWFAMFGSLILYGLPAYIGLRRWSWGLLLVIAVILRIVLFHGKAVTDVVNAGLVIAVPVHVYWMTMGKDRHGLGRATTVFFMTLFLVTCAALIGGYLNHIYGAAAFTCRGSSMEPTLHDGEGLVVSRFAYIAGNPKVGDIVSVEAAGVPHVADALDSADKYGRQRMIKRIIAVGGDVVEVKDGVPAVNGKVSECRVPAPSHSGSTTGEIQDKTLLAQSGAYHVPEGEYFVMGDNADNSFDSRYFGAVPRNAIEGKVVKVFWPLKHARVLK
jgi:signal peptidase I